MNRKSIKISFRYTSSLNTAATIISFIEFPNQEIPNSTQIRGFHHLKFYFNNKQITFDEARFYKTHVTHPKTSKSAAYLTSSPQTHKECQHIFKAQKKLTKLCSQFNDPRHFQMIKPDETHSSSYIKTQLQGL